MSELEPLLRRRDEVADWRQRERRRDEQLGVRPDASTTVRASWERLLTRLQGELADLERAITDHAQRPAELRAGEERLRTVPGVGARRALPLRVTGERSHALTAGQGDANGVVA